MSELFIKGIEANQPFWYAFSPMYYNAPCVPVLVPGLPIVKTVHGLQFQKPDGETIWEHEAFATQAEANRQMLEWCLADLPKVQAHERALEEVIAKLSPADPEDVVALGLVPAEVDESATALAAKTTA
jgi:hypothetical protein